MDFVVRHVSYTYISLVGSDIFLNFHILLSTMKAAFAFQILTLTSLSVPPFVSTMRHRYVKDGTSYWTSPCSVIGLMFLLLIFVILVLPLFTLCHNVAAVISISDDFFAFALGCGEKEKNQVMGKVKII